MKFDGVHEIIVDRWSTTKHLTLPCVSMGR